MRITLASNLNQALYWVPRNHLKKIALAVVILMVVLASIVNVEEQYHTWRNRMDLEVEGLHMIKGTSPPVNVTKYAMYMYLGCTASPFASVFWHVTQSIKVCDLTSSDRMCDYRMKRDYDYEELARKAGDWLQSDRFSELLDQNEVIVKVDDDTIVAKDVLDAMVDEFVKSDCKFAGTMRQREDGLFWSSGPLYFVKSDFLKKQLQVNGHTLSYHKKAEDVQMSYMLGLRDRESVCNIDVDAFKHRYYEDGRMAIRYKAYIKC